jgi:hypothetical protein
MYLTLYIGGYIIRQYIVHTSFYYVITCKYEKKMPFYMQQVFCLPNGNMPYLHVRHTFCHIFYLQDIDSQTPRRQ